MLNKVYKTRRCLLLILFFWTNAIVAQTTFTSTDVPKVISNGDANTITSANRIEADGCIEDINILNLDVTHSYIDDLEISLTSPSGTTIRLMEHPCSWQNNILINFDDSGSAYNSWPCPPTNGGTYIPQNLLSAFDNEEPNGDWILTIEDQAGGDGGSLNAWALEITTTECLAPEDCSNGIDDDGDGDIDCNDSDCSCCAVGEASTDTPIIINTSGTSTITSTITLSSGLCVSDVNILGLDVSHTWIHDMTITLTSPDGVTVTLLDEICGSQNDLFMGFDDSGAGQGSLSCPPTDGTIYQADGSLSNFNGNSVAGDWVLSISDNVGGDGGSLNGWCLEVTEDACPAPEDCGNGLDDDLDTLFDCDDPDCDCNAACTEAEICDDEIDNDCDGFTDLFDTDCPCDVGNVLQYCEPECEYEPPGIPSFDVEEEWISNVATNTLMSVSAGEMDGNLTGTEIIALNDVGGANSIYLIDGTTGLLKYHPNTIAISTLNKGVALADADRDGRGEFYYMTANGIGGNSNRIACYEYDPAGTNPGGTGTGNGFLIM